MPVTLRRGTVTAIAERHDGLVRLEVDGRPCIAYPALTGPVALGDDVLVNVQAVELGLGSGGFDVLHANLTRGLELPAEPGAHVMKLPYTPLQHAVLPRRGERGGRRSQRLAGLPVVCCSLHSQVAPVCAGLGQELEVAYVQLPGGALPVPLSDTVRRCAPGLPADNRRRRAVPGRRARVRLGRLRADRVRGGRNRTRSSARSGPGSSARARATATGRSRRPTPPTRRVALGGQAVLAPRVSSADGRERHRGLSHHTLAVLELAQGATVAWPQGLDVPPELEAVEIVDASEWRSACEGLPLSHMGRGPDEEPWFFAAAYAAGALARTLAG